jgi:hypothetical protein
VGCGRLQCLGLVLAFDVPGCFAAAPSFRLAPTLVLSKDLHMLPPLSQAAKAQPFNADAAEFVVPE